MVEGELPWQGIVNFSDPSISALEIADLEEEGREHRGLEALAGSVCDFAHISENRRWKTVPVVYLWAKRSAWEGTVGNDSFPDTIWKKIDAGGVWGISCFGHGKLHRWIQGEGFGSFINQRTIDGVEKLLYRLAEPVIFRSLQVANSNVRQNALHLLLDMFPLEDPDATKEEKDTLLDKQFFLLERLLMDDCPEVRTIAVEGALTKTGAPNTGQCPHSTSCGSRSLTPSKGCQEFQFNKVVELDLLLSVLGSDQPPVAQKITKLLMPSYFPSKVPIEEACNRCITLVRRAPMAGATFCKFAILEGASKTHLMELVKVFLTCEPSYTKALKEFLTAEKVKGLLAMASTGQAQSSFFNIVSTVCPDDVAGLIEKCMAVISEVSIVHCGHYDYMDVSPVLAYITLALQMTVDNVGTNNIKNSGSKRKKHEIDSSTMLSETVLELTIENILKLFEKYLEQITSLQDHKVDNLHSTNGKSPKSSKRQRLSPTNACHPGSIYNKPQLVFCKAKMLTAVLKFMADTTAMCFAPHNHGLFLNYTSKCVQHMWILRNPAEAFALANNLLDLIVSIESCMGPGYASRLAAAAKPWLPDVILALGSASILQQTDNGRDHSTASEQMKLHFPKWPLIVAKIELSVVNEAEEDDECSQSENFSAFNKLLAMLIVLLKKNPSIMDAVGVIFLDASLVGLEQKDLGLALGLLQFVCFKLFKQDDKEWGDMMLSSLQEVYHKIEREIAEENNKMNWGN
ncbi:Condensin-2 complex subunit G2 [Sesbania bispinosa]|nr:Condensin-2 complex subunit G2 [Sesbania bispinosa]